MSKPRKRNSIVFPLLKTMEGETITLLAAKYKRWVKDFTAGDADLDILDVEDNLIGKAELRGLFFGPIKAIRFKAFKKTLIDFGNRKELLEYLNDNQDVWAIPADKDSYVCLVTIHITEVYVNDEAQD